MSKTINGRLKNLDKYIQEKWKEHYMNFVLKYSTKRWDWKSLSENPNTSMEIIDRYSNAEWAKWDWEYVSLNPNITIEIIEKYSNKPLDWEWISSNPNITMEVIEKYINANCKKP